MNVQSARFPLMDSLRAIAALSVFVYHVAFVLGWFDEGLAGRYLRELNLGVSIFFVLSGFLLYRPFVAARVEGEPSPALVPYAIRRVARIVPAYWVALTIIAIWLPVSGVFTAEGIVTYYGFLQAYDPDTITGGIGQAWTLTVEVSFYILLPILALGLRRVPGPVVRGELMMVAVLFAAGVLWKVLMLRSGGSLSGSLTAFVTLPAFLDQFAVGMGLAVASVVVARRADEPAPVRVVAQRPWLAWLVAAIAFAALGAREGVVAWGSGSELIETHELKTVVAAGLILPAVFGEASEGWVRRVLAFRPLLWLGLVSYAFYLWHLAILEKLDRAGLASDLGALPYALIALVATAAVAAASWYGLERHALRLGRRLAGGPAGALETRAPATPLAPLARPVRTPRLMRRLAGAAATAVLLAGPFVLAFFSGGFFDRPRLTAALVAWLLVGVAALVSPVPLPRALPGRLALGSLALLCALTALSLEWGPLAQDVVDDTGRLLLYLGVLVAAVALLRGARARAALEPVLAGGALVVVLYGLSERFLPGVIELARSTTAAGRLEQPLTYWNAMGGMAALGIVLATRVAGDPERSPVLRAAAAAAAVPLGLGVYMSFSRGALLSACLGLLALCVLAPALRAQARACLVAAAAAGLAAGAAAALPATRTLEGGGRTAQGAVLLAAVLLLAAGSAALAARAPAGPERARTGLLVRRPGLAIAGVIAAIVVAVAAGAALERAPEPGPFGATSARFASAETTRYGYWGVALDAFADHPLRGVGSGGFAVEWLRERDVPERAHDAHSLYIETAAELGVAGLLALAGLIAAIVLAAGRLHRRAPGLATGPAAAFAAWALHAGLDWTWEMPALTLVALLLAGALLAWSEEEGSLAPAHEAGA